MREIEGKILMTSMYAMQRANGDWFAFDDRGRLRVPVFRSSGSAMSARKSNAGMLLFKPVALDEHSLGDIASTNDGNSAYFWLVDESSTSVSRGQSIERTQLVGLMQDVTEQVAG